VIIFCNSSESCEEVSKTLEANNIPNLPFNAKVESNLRSGALHMYFTKECRVLVASDLLAWGIDTVDTEHVIEYEFSNNATKYIHRVGWTGRMGSIGKVTTFLQDGDFELAEEIMKRQRADTRLDDVFSRKGSFRTKVKRR